MKIILYQPQIPQNAGNIVRTCAVTGSDLIMVRPLGFSTQDRWLKRAGLDYWEGVKVSFIDDLPAYLSQQNAPFYFFSSKATKLYNSVSYSPDALLIFGSETTGLPASFFETWPDRFVKLPMVPHARCLNLATSAGIALYEAWRQQNFQFESES
ncbi:tRNA (cytidine(34)-2'-O)-methyltransferase [Candidatus Protochlamydia phocaeensis]|uniref:tRNA (cytidine(34)-2'-O)-methyltransferase n=1 Tax=Candidatus Protochlamydia phocaeensis TaxID=1414722 RepID=UPI000838A03F|nr:tRNA (cytidine(34)-2'-O)-methyltransferase [Candidatus Protochlamydia phocaeensis]